jgi:uncharacterized membrane protein YphA (DoxX/SURF4 family)
MEKLKAAFEWVDQHRDVMLDLLRIYTGVALFFLGSHFVTEASTRVDLMRESGMGFASAGVAHLVAMAHLAGGLMLAFGVATRLAALVQIPPVASALFYLQGPEGPVPPSQILEFSALVLFILALFAVAGSGRLSVDSYLERTDGQPLWFRPHAG